MVRLQLVDSWVALKEQWLVTEIDQMMASVMTGSLDFALGLIMVELLAAGKVGYWESMLAGTMACLVEKLVGLKISQMVGDLVSQMDEVMVSGWLITRLTSGVRLTRFSTHDDKQNRERASNLSKHFVPNIS